jgi:hypothetical protein
VLAHAIFEREPNVLALDLNLREDAALDPLDPLGPLGPRLCSIR